MAGGMVEPLSPREIQARVRAGASPEELAAETGWDLARIERYAQPLIVERAFVADSAKDAMIRTPHGAMELAQAVTAVLFEAGVPVHLARWDSWRRPDGRWIVTVTFPAGQTSVRASWGFDLRSKSLTDIDEAARWAIGDSQVSLDELARLQTVVLPTRRRSRQEAESREDAGPADRGDMDGTHAQAHGGHDGRDEDQDRRGRRGPQQSSPGRRPSEPGASGSAGPSGPTSRPSSRPTTPRRPVGPPRALIADLSPAQDGLAMAQAIDLAPFAEPVSTPDDARPGSGRLSGAGELAARDGRQTQPLPGGVFRRLAVVPAPIAAPADDEGPGVPAVESVGPQAPLADPAGPVAPGSRPVAPVSEVEPPASVPHLDDAEADACEALDAGHEEVAPEPEGAEADGAEADGAEPALQREPSAPPATEPGPIVARSPGEVPRTVDDEPASWRPGHATIPGMRRPRPPAGSRTWDAVTGQRSDSDSRHLDT